jgi:alginate O-acetyltransferase complex protein AlgI
LGFDFPQNFHRPYLAWSVTEFWRRWHMTLSSWLRDYLYIPLGGNRHGALATYRNLLITMLLGGLWHGANWTFVVWGGYHGLLLAAERALGIGRNRKAAAPRDLRRAGATLATFALVSAGWVFFRAQTFGDAAATLHALALGGPGPLMLGPSDFAIVAIALGIEIALEARLISGARRVALTVLTLVVLELGAYPGAATPFVYFKF